MAYDIKVDPEQDLSIIRLHRQICGRVFTEVLGILSEHEAWQPGMARLWDWTEVWMMEVELHHVDTFVQALGTHPLRATRTAIVVRNEVHEGIAHLVRFRVKTCAVAVFHTEEAALHWLRA